MIKEVNLGVEKVALDTIKMWILDQRMGGIDKHIIVAVKDKKPYILKTLPILDGYTRGDGFCFFGLYDSKMHLTPRYAGDFVTCELGWVNKMYVLDTVKDLINFLQNLEENKTNLWSNINTLTFRKQYNIEQGVHDIMEGRCDPY